MAAIFTPQTEQTLGSVPDITFAPHFSTTAYHFSILSALLSALIDDSSLLDRC